MYVEQLPIRVIDGDNPDDVALRDELVTRVERMLALHAGTAAEVKARQAEIARLDREIDRLVYRLYGLTDDEIALVEGRVQGNA